MAEIELKIETFHQKCFGFFRGIRWNSFGKFSATVLLRGSNSWSKMLLWLSNRHGKRPLLNLLPPHWHIHQRFKLKKLPFFRHYKYWRNSWKSSMGTKMDEYWTNIPWKSCCFCSCWGDLLFWIILCNLLAEEKINDAWTNLLEWTYLKRRGTSYRLRLSLVLTDEEQTATWAYPINYQIGCRDIKKIYFLKSA